MEQLNEKYFDYDNIMPFIQMLPDEEKRSLLARLKVSEIIAILNTENYVAKYCLDMEYELGIWERALGALKKLDRSRDFIPDVMSEDAEESDEQE